MSRYVTGTMPLQIRQLTNFITAGPEPADREWISLEEDAYGSTPNGQSFVQYGGAREWC